MRKLSVVLASAVLLAGLASPAGAAVLNWEGTSVPLLGDFPRLARIRGGGVATINKSGGLGHVNELRIAASRGGLRGSFTQLVTDPDTVGNSIAAIRYIDVAGGTGTYANISGAAASTTVLTQNTLPVSGTIRLCLVTTDCQDFLELNLLQMTANGTVAVGVGGLLTVGGDSNIKISIQAAPWTIKTATVIDQITTINEANRIFVDVKLFGFAHGTNSGTTNTADIGGVIQLVTPNQVRTNLPLGSNQETASGITTINRFIPEPGLLLLLGSGVITLAVLGRQRMRK